MKHLDKIPQYFKKLVYSANAYQSYLIRKAKQLWQTKKRWQIADYLFLRQPLLLWQSVLQQLKQPLLLWRPGLGQFKQPLQQLCATKLLLIHFLRAQKQLDLLLRQLDLCMERLEEMKKSGAHPLFKNFRYTAGICQQQLLWHHNIKAVQQIFKSPQYDAVQNISCRPFHEHNAVINCRAP